MIEKISAALAERLPDFVVAQVKKTLLPRTVERPAEEMDEAIVRETVRKSCPLFSAAEIEAAFPTPVAKVAALGMLAPASALTSIPIGKLSKACGDARLAALVLACREAAVPKVKPFAELAQ